MNKYILRPDTPAWVGQAWGFFALACGFELTALSWLPIERSIKILLVLILVLTVYTCFAVSKTIRDNRDRKIDTGAWIMMTYGVAATALFGLFYGIFFITPEWELRMMLGGGLAWCIESALVLAKTIRDNEEARTAFDPDQSAPNV